jgi:hypothetical protein
MRGDVLADVALLALAPAQASANVLLLVAGGGGAGSGSGGVGAGTTSGDKASPRAAPAELGAAAARAEQPIQAAPAAAVCLAMARLARVWAKAALARHPMPAAPAPSEIQEVTAAAEAAG